MRRVIATPTFAASLGVVIAAVMVYPMSRTVFSYGARCQAAGCGAGAGAGWEGQPSAQPGQQFGLGAQSPSRLPDQPTGAGTSSPGEPIVTYLTLRQWDGGFTGQITLAFKAHAAPARWELRLSYPSYRIVSVWGGTWLAESEHTAIVASVAGTSAGRQGIQVGYSVDGSAGPPPVCVFNGRTCRFRKGTGRNSGGRVSGLWAAPMAAATSRGHCLRGNRRGGAGSPGG